MSGHDLDVLVIGGGGSAGFTAATTAMRAGGRVGMAERGRLGGLCILAGCMPSKTLLHAAAELKQTRPLPAGAYADLLARKRQVVEYLAGRRVEAVTRKLAKGLALYQGQARFIDAHTLAVGDKTLSAQAIVVATGSRETIPPLPGLEQAGYLLAEGLMEAAEPPRSLLVLGGGAIALEMAQYAARLGVEVTLLQRGATLLSKEDPKVGQALAAGLAADGVQVLTGVELLRVEAGPQGKRVFFRRQGVEQSALAQEILLALGRVANLEGLELERAGLSPCARGCLEVDAQMRTKVPHIYAAGDVTGVNMVVNLAIVQGEVAGHNASGQPPRAIDDRVIPRAVFCDPQFARVGLNQAEAAQAGLDCVEASQDLAAMGVARTYSAPTPGFMAMRAEKGSGRVVGAELVAPEASLMIHDLVVGMRLGVTALDLAEMPYIHPSLSEITVWVAEELARKLRGQG